MRENHDGKDTLCVDEYRVREIDGIEPADGYDRDVETSESDNSYGDFETHGSDNAGHSAANDFHGDDYSDTSATAN